MQKEESMIQKKIVAISLNNWKMELKITVPGQAKGEMLAISMTIMSCTFILKLLFLSIHFEMTNQFRRLELSCVLRQILFPDWKSDYIKNTDKDTLQT